jgi:hypothetical protein
MLLPMDSRPVCLGVKPPSGTQEQIVGLLVWGALSDERTGLSFTIADGPCQLGTHDHILLSQIRDSPNLEGQVPVFISPRNRVAQLYPQAFGSLFVASYDSQGYGGGIRTCFNAGILTTELLVLVI